MKIILATTEIKKLHEITKIILEIRSNAKLELQLNDKNEVEDLLIID